MAQITKTNIISWQRGAPMRDGEPVVAVIGNFDGVHKGHQHLIATARDLADDLGLPLAVLTFAPHPRAFFRPKDPPFLLMDPVQKQQILSEMGASLIVNITFDEALRVASPEEFANEVLRPLQIVHLFAGADFAFAKARSGGIETLAALGRAFNMKATGVPLATDDHQMVISSSRIRAALQAGQVSLAEHMLGRPHRIAGIVAKGDQRGRTIGFPTANVPLISQLQPAFGVYAITVKIGDDARSFDGVANIGLRPTVNDRGVLAEAHLFDFSDDIYGQRIEITLQGYVRSEMKFTGIDALKEQISKDTQTAKMILAS
ncbi:MAG: bifunctional riboflavin kinase/FAD synthetase [Candidatus Puniceispirillaceae bacterium]